jgi:tagatose-1,6-bisphosphate aldolase
MQLPRIQTKTGKYLLLDLSDIHESVDVFGITWETDEQHRQLEALIALIVSQLSPLVSGIVLGPEIGFSALEQKAAQTGLLLSLEKQTDLLLVNEMPRVFPQWGVTHVRNNYGILFTKLFYHPKGELALEKKRLMAELKDACRYEGIANVLSLSLYPPAGQPANQEAFQESQLTSIREFQTVADLLLLEYPHTALAAATITAELDIPWVLVDRTQDYLHLKTALRTSLEAGAAGISVGGGNLFSSILPFELDKDRVTQESMQQFETHLKTEVRDRLLEINRILEEQQDNEV